VLFDQLKTRPAEPADAAPIALIYNQGIEDRIATFETEPRSVSSIEAWFDQDALIRVVEAEGQVVGYAAAFPYSDRCCYSGIGEFTVYVRRDQRGRRVGEAAMWALLEAAQDHGHWKLLSRIFTENTASRSLMARLGFKEIGIQEKHGKLDGAWRDCVIVERLIPENLL
jgi:L-amino acid N-acyltransferase YncA